MANLSSPGGHNPLFSLPYQPEFPHPNALGLVRPYWSARRHYPEQIHKALFGNTALVTEQLEKMQDNWINLKQMRNLVVGAGLPDEMRFFYSQFPPLGTAGQLAIWYIEWEKVKYQQYLSDYDDYIWL